MTLVFFFYWRTRSFKYFQVIWSTLTINWWRNCIFYIKQDFLNFISQKSRFFLESYEFLLHVIYFVTHLFGSERKNQQLYFAFKPYNLCQSSRLMLRVQQSQAVVRKASWAFFNCLNWKWKLEKRHRHLPSVFKI